MTDEIFEDGFDIDGAEILEALGNVDPNAKQTDSPPPPEDGAYRILVFPAPITKDGHPFQGRTVAPFTEKEGGKSTAKLKISDGGVQNATLYVNVTVLGADGKTLTKRPLYLSSLVGGNGTSDVIALAKSLGFIEGETPAEFAVSIINFIKSQREEINGVPTVRQNIPWLLAEAVAIQLNRAASTGLETTASLISTLKVDSGKKDAAGYVKWDTAVTGSAAIKAKGMWKGGLQTGPDGKSYRIELEITDFGASLEG